VLLTKWVATLGIFYSSRLENYEIIPYKDETLYCSSLFIIYSLPWKKPPEFQLPQTWRRTVFHYPLSVNKERVCNGLCCVNIESKHASHVKKPHLPLSFLNVTIRIIKNRKFSLVVLTARQPWDVCLLSICNTCFLYLNYTFSSSQHCEKLSYECKLFLCMYKMPNFWD
jgi:hypothetical protein